MTEIQMQAIQRAVSLLNASGAQYKVLLPDGTAYGELEVVIPKVRTRTQRVPQGSLLAIYKDKMDAAQIGDVVQISLADIANTGTTLEGMRGTCTAYGTKIWGKGSYISTVTETHVELLRIS